MAIKTDFKLQNTIQTNASGSNKNTSTGLVNDTDNNNDNSSNTNKNNNNTNQSISSGSSMNIIQKPTNNSQKREQMYGDFINNYGNQQKEYLQERLDYLKHHSYQDLLNSNLMTSNARWQAMKNTNNILKAQGYGSQGMIGSNQTSLQNAYLNALQNNRSDYAQRNNEYDLSFNESMMNIQNNKDQLYGDYIQNMIDRENQNYQQQLEMWYQQELANQQHKWEQEQQQAEWDREDQQNDELADITNDDTRLNLILDNITGLDKESAKDKLISAGIMNDDGTWNQGTFTDKQLQLIKDTYNMADKEGANSKDSIKDYLSYDESGKLVGFGELGTTNEVTTFNPIVAPNNPVANAFMTLRGYYDKNGKYVLNNTQATDIVSVDKIQELADMPKYSDSALQNQDTVIKVTGNKGTFYLAYIQGSGYLTISKKFYDSYSGNKITI